MKVKHVFGAFEIISFSFKSLKKFSNTFKGKIFHQKSSKATEVKLEKLFFFFVLFLVI